MPRKRPPGSRGSSRERTQMTPEQKAAKAARERERYQKARKAGFTPEESRSLKKSLSKQPDILKEPTDALLDLMGSVKGAADWLLNLASDAIKPDKPNRKGGRTSPKSGSSRAGGRTSEPKARKPAAPRRDYGDFADFARSRPGVPANELIRQYRKQGGSIGNEKGKEIIRDVTGREKQKGKVTRFRYYSNDEKPIFGGTKKLIKDRYMYLVQFEIELEDAADTKTDWMYVTSNRQLNMREIREHTLDAWADGYVDGREKYKALRIIPESIELIHAVDTSL